MKTTLLFFAILLSISTFYGCKKEIDVIVESNNESTTSSIKFIYHNQTVSRSDFDANNPDLVMVVEANNTVYVFDTHEEFLDWAQTTSHANSIVQFEEKRMAILNNSNSQTQTSNKTNIACMLYEDCNNGDTGASKLIILGWPYSSLGSMDNKASSINGLAVVTCCYDKTNFSGSRVYVLCAGAAVYFADLGFDNRTSSVLSF